MNRCTKIFQWLYEKKEQIIIKKSKMSNSLQNTVRILPVSLASPSKTQQGGASKQAKKQENVRLVKSALAYGGHVFNLFNFYPTEQAFHLLKSDSLRNSQKQATAGGFFSEGLAQDDSARLATLMSYRHAAVISCWRSLTKRYVL